MIDNKSTVGTVAAERPEAARVFERLGIDYCCGGKRPLADVCREKGIDFEQLVQSLEQPVEVATVAHDWAKESLSSLVSHIISKHHVYTDDALTRLDALSEKVCRVHGSRHPEIVEVRDLFQGLRAELDPHLMKEERILFPYIKALDASPNEQPSSCFGTVRNPIKMMELEHDGAGQVLARLREVTQGYTLPADACASYSALYHGLEELEQDLHQHIHLENNVLFPRAVELEARISGGTA